MDIQSVLITAVECLIRDFLGIQVSVMESRDLVPVSRHVSRPVFSSLGLCLGLEGFWSRSRALSLETCMSYLLYEVLQETAT